MIISRTPYRISFLGGGTDYPVWYQEHGGSVLSTSIDKYCYITCRYLPPFFKHTSRVVYSKIELVDSVEDIQHPAVRATLQEMGIGDGIEIHHDGDMPARTGIGSSSSFTVGLLHALHALKHQMLTKKELTKKAIHIERDLLQENVGSQDQAAAAYGGFNRINFSQNGKISVQPVILSGERLVEFESHIMLFFTGFSRYASTIAEKQIANTHKKQDALVRMHGMVEEGLEILTGKNSLKSFGELLHESWMLKRSLADGISSTEIDQMYDIALEAGAYGGKLVGAGGGGFMMIFAPPENQEAIREKLKELLLVPLRFETSGSQIVFYRPNRRKTDRLISDYQ